VRKGEGERKGNKKEDIKEKKGDGWVVPGDSTKSPFLYMFLQIR